MVIIIWGCSGPNPPLPLKLKEVKVVKVESDDDGCDTMVEVLVEASGINLTSATPYQSKLVDVSGREYTIFEFTKGKGSIIIESDYNTDTEKVRKFGFKFPLAQIPKEAGEVFFQTTILADESNSIPIQIEIR